MYISSFSGYIFFFLFGIAMLAITFLFRSKSISSDEFLLAERRVGWFTGGCSIAASWIWAPALFIASQVAYEKGLAGVFWFVVPNILALVLFVFLAPRIRKKLPQGYTFPEYIRSVLGGKRIHTLYLFPFFFYQLMAVTVQVFAGGNLVALLTGIPVSIAMILLAVIALSYTLIAGFRASVTTDVLQMIIILIFGGGILFFLWQHVGGFSPFVSGFAGIENTTGVFDAHVAFSFGIVTALGLLAGAVTDQQYWQRSFAIQSSELKRAFLFGAFLFGLVPLGLALPGFLAAVPAFNIQLPQGVDVSLIGVQTIATLLPQWALMLFVLMLLAGLSSTLDSGISAASSLWMKDVATVFQKKTLFSSPRFAMVLITVLGLFIAFLLSSVSGFGLQHLWWIMNTMAACIMMPTLLSFFNIPITERGVFWGILIAFGIGMPFFIYANIKGDTVWIVGSTLFIFLCSTVLCFLPAGNTIESD